MRAAVLRRDPVCRDDSGCDLPAVEVDHRVPRYLGGSNDPANLRGLCREHHAEKTKHEAEAARRAWAEQRSRWRAPRAHPGRR